MADTAERDKTLDFSWSKMAIYFLAVMSLCFYLFMLYKVGMFLTFATCKELPHYFEEEIVPGYSVIDSDVKIMMVGDMLLSGSQAGYFEEFLFQMFFVEALRKKDPDAVIVVGDLSARGADISVLEQFQRFLSSTPVPVYYAVLGDKDIGGCRFSASGSATMQISGVYFFSLNSMALVCNNNDLRSSVNDVLSSVERELREERRHKKVKRSQMDDSSLYRYGPFLVLHFPLYPKLEKSCRENTFMNRGLKQYTVPYISEIGNGPFKFTKTLAENDTRYVIQELRPRMVFSGHAQRYCHRTHPDGIHEVTVPPMTWDGGNIPVFVLVTIKRDGTVTVDLCRFPQKYEAWMMCFLFAMLAILGILTAMDFLLELHHETDVLEDIADSHDDETDVRVMN